MLTQTLQMYRESNKLRRVDNNGTYYFLINLDLLQKFPVMNQPGDLL